jgi:hypothetical protein
VKQLVVLETGALLIDVESLYTNIFQFVGVIYSVNSTVCLSNRDYNLKRDICSISGRPD